MAQVDREFFKKYHRAVVKSVSGELEKVKARVGSAWADEFRAYAGEDLQGEDFHSALEDYLQNELRFCDLVKVKGDDNDLSIEVKGCHICHGNEELRRRGEPALCPIVPTGLFSVSRVAGKKATLREVCKNGVVGECEIRYDIS